MHEIEKKDDGLHDFLKEHEARLVVPLDGEIMAGTKEVLPSSRTSPERCEDATKRIPS